MKNNLNGKILFLLLIIALSSVNAQELSKMRVSGNSELLSGELINKSVRDQNGDICSGIIIISDLTGLSFQSSLGIVKNNPSPGKDFLFLSPGEKIIEVFCSGFEPLKLILSEIGIKLNSGEVWQVKITGNKKLDLIPVNVLSDQEADVFIDGINKGHGKVNTIGIAVGSHQLRMVKEGFKSIDEKIDVSATKNLFTYKMQSIDPVVVTFQSIPDGAKIFLNAMEKGETNKQIFLFPTKYELKLQKSGYLDITQTIDIKESGENTFSFNLSKNLGYLSVQADPSDAEIYINKEKFQYVSMKEFAPGTYKIEVTRANYYPQEEIVNLKIGDNVSKKFTLVPKVGTLQFSIQPHDANVVLERDGKQVNSWQGLKLLKNLVEGRYTIRATASGYDNASREFEIAENQNAVVEMTMQKTVVQPNYSQPAQTYTNNPGMINENFKGSTTALFQNEYWKLQDGNFVCTNGVEGKSHWSRINTDFTNCTISVKAKWTARSKDYGFGIYFGGQGDAFYYFSIAPSGYYKLSRYTGTEWKDIVDWVQTTLVRDGFNDLKVVCNGKNIMGYLNDNLVVNVTEDNFTGGSTGLCCSGAVDAAFADFIVIPSSDAGTNAFSENFNAPTSTFYQDDIWVVKNGMLTCSNGATDKAYWSKTDNSFTNCSISVRARWDGRATDRGFGIMFGRVGDARYSFGICSSGYYTLQKWTGTEWKVLVEWVQTTYVQSGFNDLKIVCNNKNIMAYINNNLVINQSDDSYEGGLVGVYCDGNTDASFDDFVVSSLSGAPAKGPVTVVNENFDSSTTEFTPDANWKLGDGVFTCSNGSETQCYWDRILRSYTDCTIYVKAKWVGRSQDEGFGIYFGGNGVVHFMFSIAASGYYTLQKWDGTNWIKQVDWVKTQLIHEGFNDLKVVCSGKNIMAYVNDNLVININENTYSGGMPGVYCGGRTDAAFDNFIVTIPGN